MRQGVIDIGTNSVKLLIADVCGKDIMPVHESSRQTRLGQGLYANSQLQPEPIKATVVAVKELLSLAVSEGCIDTRIIATSAVREAVNAGELQQALGHAVEVLSGASEACLAFNGVMSCPRLNKKSVFVIDVGGGSTEFIVGDIDRMLHHSSIRLGSVRLMESHPVFDPPEIGELKAIIGSIDRSLDEETMQGLHADLDEFGGVVSFAMIGSGGMAGILANMELATENFDRERMETVELSLDCVTLWRERLWGMTLAKRQEITGLPSNRADVALYGSLIYEQLMRRFGFAVLRVSTRGIRYGALRSLKT